MGSSNSKAVSVNNNNQTIVNKNAINFLNQQISETISKTTINNSAKCMSSVNQSQVLDLSGCEAGQDINVTNVDMKQVAVVDFSCIQVSSIQNTVAQEIMSEIMGQIKANTDATSLNSMDAAAAAAATTGTLAAGTSDADSTSVNNFNLQVRTDNTTNIQNIIKTSINNEFNVEDVQNCINQIDQEQKINLSRCKAGNNINVSGIKMEQGITSTAKCVQEKNVAQKIIDNAVSRLGVIIEAETKSKAEVTMKATSESTAATEGLNDLLGASCGSSDSAGSAQMSIICIIIVIVLAVLGGIAWYMMKSNGGKGSRRRSSRGFGIDSPIPRSSRSGRSSGFGYGGFSPLSEY